MSRPPNRFDYVKYDDKAVEQQAEAKELAQKLEAFISKFGQGRYQALAITKLEECYMFIGKFIRDVQIARNEWTEQQEERNDS